MTSNRWNQSVLGFALIVLISCTERPLTKATYELNDIHSQLNPTKHAAVVSPTSRQELQAIVRKAKRDGHAISISGGRHSMGGQQFGTGTININMSLFDRVLSLDANKGIVEVQSGIQWPALIDWLRKHQDGSKPKWGIRQKQTGADRLSIGGALSSNIHGRGLKMRPMIEDVESFTLVDANGNLRTCSRTENPELFGLAIGGYGLFGVIETVKIRLAPITTLRREVRLIDVRDFITLTASRIREGYLYGDFQFAIDPFSDDFMRRGVYSVYNPIANGEEGLGDQSELKQDDWNRLLALAHTDKSRAFDLYSKFYLSTNGQFYQSDTHQMGVYVDDYHRQLDVNSNASEMISEIYVPRSKLALLFEQLREDFRKHKVNLVYGTVRLIEKDGESFLAWAKQDYASIVFNFHVEHTPEGMEKAKLDFRALIARALEHDGSYYLTYHRWATREQVLKAYPQMPAFLRLKKKYDPEERFQSDWYRHYRQMFADTLSGQ
ncbi:MAG: FAD-dependent oxidoreductase [Candidatus Korobacteraceae bacterium]